MKFVISTDAGSDLDVDYIKKNDVKMLSMTYTLTEGKDEKEFVFGNGEAGLSNGEFYAKLRAGIQAKTMLINEEQHIEHFKKLVANGDNVLHITLSSGLSGTAENAVKAAGIINAESKGGKVSVVDFKGASMGQGLVVDYLVGMRDSGKSLEDSVKWVEENKLKFAHYFTVDDLGHLRRGGRLSGGAALIGSIIGIKPILHVNDDGKLIPVGKKIGRKKSLMALVEKMKELIDGTEQKVFISHADSYNDAKFVADEITKEFGIKDITIGFIGPIIGAHAGPGTIALFFMGKHR